MGRANLVSRAAILVGSLIALLLDIFILPMAYPSPVSGNMLFTIFILSLFGVIVGYSRLTNPRPMTVMSGSETIGALVGLGWALAIALSWRSRVSLLIPDLGISLFGSIIGAAVGYVVGLYVEMTWFNYTSRQIKTSNVE